MKILFDHNTPRVLRRHLTEHIIDTGREKGWAELRNGSLLDNGKREGCELLITADQSMRYQQNLNRRQMAVLVLGDNRWPYVRLQVAEIRTVIDRIQPGELREVPISSSREG